jgi:hypothetical protein
MEIIYAYSYICNLYLISVSVLVYLQGKIFHTSDLQEAGEI